MFYKYNGGEICITYITILQQFIPNLNKVTNWNLLKLNLTLFGSLVWRSSLVQWEIKEPGWTSWSCDNGINAEWGTLKDQDTGPIRILPQIASG